MTSDAIILFLGPPEGYEAVKEACSGGPFLVLDVEPSSAALRRVLPQASALVDASMKVTIDDTMVREADQLEIISCATTGSDHIARGELERRGIELRTLRDDRDLLQGLTPAAEHSWGLLMACARRLVPAVRHVQQGGWDRELFPGIMLRGKRLGLVGCGRLGSWMARYAHAFGLSVVGYDPHVSPWPDGIESVSLDELFRTSDFISLHVHLNDETRGLVSRSLLEQTKPGAILINTSRGALLDESAVADALEGGRLGAFGADVLCGEPEVEGHRLVRMARQRDDIVLTPHIGGFSPDALRLVCRRAVEKVIRHLEKS